MGNRPTSPLGDSSRSGAATNAPRGDLGKDPMAETRGEEDESDEEDQDIEMPDLMVKTATYEVGIANQSLKNAIDARAHLYQSKERVEFFAGHVAALFPLVLSVLLQRNGDRMCKVQYVQVSGLCFSCFVIG
ncbi:hypothetical protein U1Q18_019891 [Sarracenia purpurea var. burkii]